MNALPEKWDCDVSRLYHLSQQPREGSIELCLKLVSAALNVLQMENENIFKFLAAEMWLTYTSFDDQNSNDIDVVNRKSTWHLLAAQAVIGSGNHTDISGTYSWNSGQHMVVTLVGCFTSGTVAKPNPNRQGFYLSLPTIALGNISLYVIWTWPSCNIRKLT